MAHETTPNSSFSSTTVSRGYAANPNAVSPAAGSYVAATRMSPVVMASGEAPSAEQEHHDAMASRATAVPNAMAATPPHGDDQGVPLLSKPLVMPAIKRGLPLKRLPEEVRRVAIEVFPQCDSWVIFYRAILGVDGVARKLFKDVDQIRYWEDSAEFAEIQEMVAALRAQGDQKSDSAEPLRMITIRLPVSLHESLKVESQEHETSMNKLCLSKLLVSINPKLVPPEKGGIRGRKPGPQGKRSEAPSASR